MTLIPVQCTKCGATLKVDCNKETTICEYCRTSFVVEKDIFQGGSGVEGFEIVDKILLMYHGASSDVFIPKGVVEIGNKAFTNNRSIFSVTIPDTVKRIGQLGKWGLGAFGNCKNLRKVNIPDSVEFLMFAAFAASKNIEEVDISSEKLLSFGPVIIESCFSGSTKKQLLKRLEKESVARGICWSCQTPLNLNKGGKCKNCGFYTDLSLMK